MSDLARRLEARADRLDAGDLTDLSGALEREAAAEIERLRKALAAERERCAKIAETCPVWLAGEEPMPELRPTAAITRGRIAAAIRAGGQP